MGVDDIKDSIEEIKSDSEKLLRSSVEYYKLVLFKAVAQSLSGAVTFLLLAGIGFVAILFIAIAAAFALGSYLENNALGFLIVGGVFFVNMCLVFLLRKKIIDAPLLSKFSEKYFK